MMLISLGQRPVSHKSPETVSFCGYEHYEQIDTDISCLAHHKCEGETICSIRTKELFVINICESVILQS